MNTYYSLKYESRGRGFSALLKRSIFEQGEGFGYFPAFGFDDVDKIFGGTVIDFCFSIIL